MNCSSALSIARKVLEQMSNDFCSPFLRVTDFSYAGFELLASYILICFPCVEIGCQKVGLRARNIFLASRKMCVLMLLFISCVLSLEKEICEVASKMFLT